MPKLHQKEQHESPKEKVCIVWEDADGNVERSRFFKGYSTHVVDAVLKSKQQNVNCFDPEIMTRSKWEKYYGPINEARSPVRSHKDLSMVEPDYSMKKWRQDNFYLYQNSNTMCFVNRPRRRN